MALSILDVAHHVLLACYNRGSDGFFPRVDSDKIDLDRALVDQVLDQLRLGGFVEIAGWDVAKGQGYRVTEAGAKAVAHPALLNRPAAREINPYQRPEFQGDEFEEIRRSVLSPPPALATPVLILINVAIYVGQCVYSLQHGISLAHVLNGLMLPIPGALEPLEFFALDRWWLLVSYSFLHGGPIHILMNMYCLYTLGNLMEGRWGILRFLLLYFGSAIIGGVAVILAYSNPESRTVGASGAIAGLLTSLAVWAWMHRRFLPPQFVEAHFRVVGLNLVILIGTSLMPNISMSAHVGGAIGGAVLSIPLAWMGPRSPLRHRIVGLCTIALIAITCVALIQLVAPPPNPDLILQFLFQRRLMH